MELIEWEGIKASVMSPGKARLYSTLIFAALHFVPPLVKTASKVRSLVNIWLNGPGDSADDIRTPLPSTSDLAALEDAHTIDFEKRISSMTWNVWDSIELGLTMFQAVADMGLLSAAIRLQYYEIRMAHIMSTLQPSVAREVVAEQTALYFRERAEHRILLNASRKWIFTSFALDALHLAGNIAHVIYDHYYTKSKHYEIDNAEHVPRPTHKLSWRHFLRSAIFYNIVSVATNSLWYSIYVASPAFQPKGLTSFTIKVLNEI